MEINNASQPGVRNLSLPNLTEQSYTIGGVIYYIDCFITFIIIVVNICNWSA